MVKRRRAQSKQSSESKRLMQAAGRVAHSPRALRQESDLDALQRAAADPSRAAPADVLTLGRSYGNQAVSDLLQAKLVVNGPGDAYEQEADRVAERISGKWTPASTRVSPGRGQPAAQRQEMAEEKGQTLPVKDIQGLTGGAGMVATPEVESAIQQARGGGRALGDSVRAPMEGAFGADFSGVRVHTDEQADTLNRSLQARAFTTGHDIFFKSGEYSPGSLSGQKLLAHELTHTLQQGASARIQRWGPMGTSHSKVTKAALAQIDDPNALEFYGKARIRRHLSQCAADMDNRENAKPSGGQILQGIMSMLKLQKLGVRVKYPVYTPMGGKWARKRGKKSLFSLRKGGKRTLFPWRTRSLAERVRAWENVEGYTRVETEQVNHAESGMYRLHENRGAAGQRTRERAKLWLRLAVNAGKRQVAAEAEGAEPNWNDVFLRLGLALHTIEDIGAHGHGLPDWGRHQRGHDPRRFVKPPYYEALSTYGRAYRPRSYDLYRKGASFGDCDNAAKNPGGYDLSVYLTKKTLEGFANKFVGVKPRLKSKGARKLLAGWLPTWMPRGANAGNYWKNWYYPRRTRRGIKMVYLPKG